MKTLYLISLDNGESYEDHRRDPVCIVPDEEAAKTEIARIMAWVESKKLDVPKQPSDPWPDDADQAAVDAYDKTMGDWQNAVDVYLASLKPSHEEQRFLHMVEGNGFGAGAYLVSVRLPFVDSA